MEHRVRSFNHTPLDKIARTFYGVVSPVFLLMSYIFLRLLMLVYLCLIAMCLRVDLNHRLHLQKGALYPTELHRHIIENSLGLSLIIEEWLLHEHFLLYDYLFCHTGYQPRTFFHTPRLKRTSLVLHSKAQQESCRFMLIITQQPSYSLSLFELAFVLKVLSNLLAHYWKCQWQVVEDSNLWISFRRSIVQQIIGLSHSPNYPYGGLTLIRTRIHGFSVRCIDRLCYQAIKKYISRNLHYQNN